MAKLLLFVEVFLAMVLSLSSADDHTEIMEDMPAEDDKVQMLRAMLQDFQIKRENNRRVRRSNEDSVFLESLPDSLRDVKTEQETEVEREEMEDASDGLCENLSQKWDSSWKSLSSMMDKVVSRLEDQENKFVEAMDKLSSTDAIINETFTKLLELGMSKNVDRCKQGWHYFEDSCYFFSFSEDDWFKGRKECQEMDSDYAKVTTTNEWNFIASQLSASSWVGLTDEDEEGTFKWVSDGTVYSDRKDSWWHYGQPDNYHGQEHCVHYWRIFDKVLWNDSKCQESMRYICEVEAQ